MKTNEEQLLKLNSQKLPPVSPKAIETFQLSFPKLVNLVNEKFLVEARFCCDRTVQEQLDFLREIHRYFGEVLLSIYEFQLYENLIHEFSWFVSTMSHRGFNIEYFEKMLNAWAMSIHGLLEPPMAHELVNPIKFLCQNVTTFLELPGPSLEIEDERQKRFVKLLLEKKRKDATEYVLSLVENGISPEELCHTLLVPSMRYIGLLWQVNELSAADEHAATEICRYITFRLCDSLPRQKSLFYKALVSCVPGEEHSLVVEMMVGYLEAKGWNVYFVGRSAPKEDILKAIVQYKPDVIFLSVTLISHLPSTKSLLMNLRKVAPDSKIVVGGSAAMHARSALEKLTDAVVNDLKDGHSLTLTWVGHHA